ncbi:MinD/ParA family protein [Rhodococcus sp. X156]|uniref:MinD/ParA family ATP-binding protein n=1 Tax=Rhodococcus sp. X156 TaxID=2499145 RepID=UPI001F49E4ED|nr:MinD/ParA family protein [Rhodococcus sp. X156]
MSDQQDPGPASPGWAESSANPPQPPQHQTSPRERREPPAGAHGGGGAHSASRGGAALQTGPMPTPLSPQGSPRDPHPSAPPQAAPPLQVPQQPAVGYSYAVPPQPAVPDQTPRGTGERTLTVEDLSAASLLAQPRSVPRSGWRKAVYLASGRTVNLGPSAADLARAELVARINQPLQGCYKIAMLSLKGGVGKTTTTVTLGSTFASLRGDRVVAVDANPDRGTLSQKIPLETAATVRHLLRDAHRITRYSDVRAYTSQGPSRLEVLASDSDPAVSEAFSEEDYRRTVDLLEHFYNIVLTDCGTGLMHSAMKGVLDEADCLVLVSSTSIDGARSAAATLDWLDMHGYQDLVRRSVAVINAVRAGSGKVDVNKLVEHFAARCRAVHVLPFDPHLEEGAEVDLERLRLGTRAAMLDLAATIADDFPAFAAR